METQKEIEDWVTMVCLCYPNYIEKIGVQTIESQDNNELIKYTRKHYKIKGTPPTYIDIVHGLENNVFGDIVPQYHIRKLFDNMSLVKNLVVEDLQKEFEISSGYLRKKSRLSQKIKKTKQALELFEAEQENAGVELLKEINFYSKVGIQDTYSLMKRSITNSNTFLSGYKAIDENLGGFMKRNLCTIVGDSGTMKTMFSIDMCHKILEKNRDFKCIYFEKETASDDIGRRILCRLLDIEKSRLIKNSSLENESDKLKNAQEVLDLLKSKYDSNDEDVNVNKRLKVISPDQFSDVNDMYQIIDHEKCDFWILDFATMLEPKKGVIDDESMRKEYKTMKTMLNDTNTFGVVLSQVKHGINMDYRKNVIPYPSDLEWGKGLKQLSSWLFSIFYPIKHYPDSLVAKDYWFYLITQKVREGKMITMPLIADYERCKFTEPDETEYPKMVKYINDYRRTK